MLHLQWMIYFGFVGRK